MREVLLTFLALLSISPIISSQTCTRKVEDERFDCYPEDGSNEKGCLSRGCCWNPRLAKSDKKPTSLNSGTDVPFCFFPEDFPNYKVVSSARRMRGGGMVYSIQKMNTTYRPNEILKLEVRVTFDTKQRLRVQIVDPNNARYQVPVFNDEEEKTENVWTGDDTDYQIAIGDSPFSIKVYRKSTARLMLVQ